MGRDKAISIAQANSIIAPDQSAVEGPANILGHLLHDAGYAADRSDLRRLFREAAEAIPGDVSVLWWRWIGEAAAELNLKCKVIDCTFEELCTLARSGVRLIAYVPDTDPWRAVTAVRGRKFRLARAFDERASHWGSQSELHAFLGAPGPQQLVRCAAIESAVIDEDANGHDEAGHYGSGHRGPGHRGPGQHEQARHGEGHHGDGHHGEMSPLTRLWRLLRPERSDLWIVVIFAFVVGVLTLAIPIATQSLIDAVAFGRLMQPVLVLTLMLLVFLAFSAAIRALEYYVIEVLQCRLFARVTADLSFRLPRVRTESQEQHYMPELVNRFFDIVTVQKVTAKLLLDGLTLILNSVIGMIVLALYHPWLLGFDIVLLATMAFIVLILGRGAVATSIKESKHKYVTAAWLEDVARCPLTFKYDGGGQFALERADRLVSEYLISRKKHFRVLMRQMVFVLMIQAIASAVLLGVGGWLVIVGQLTLGQLVAAEMIVTVIVGSFAKLGNYMEIFYDLLAAVDKLGVLLDLPVEQQEGMLYEFPLRPLSLKVHDASYSLADGASAMERVDLEVPAGERVALTGHGGSALFDLAFGLRSPTFGHLLIEGIDPRDVRPDFLRHRVALVRGIEVFHGNVAENVHLGRPHVTSHAVRDALEQVGLLDSVLQLPEAMETDLTSGGSPLSDNELRRLMLARAVVGRPGLLMIDGILDALADDEAAELMGTLCDARQPWTLLVATSRAGLRNRCDRVVELPSRGYASRNLEFTPKEPAWVVPGTAQPGESPSNEALGGNGKART